MSEDPVQELKARMKPRKEARILAFLGGSSELNNAGTTFTACMLGLYEQVKTEEITLAILLERGMSKEEIKAALPEYMETGSILFKEEVKQRHKQEQRKDDERENGTGV